MKKNKFQLNEYQDDSCLKIANRIEYLADAIGLSDYSVYISNSGLTFGIKVIGLNYNGTFDVVQTHKCGKFELENEVNFFKRYAFLIKDKENVNYLKSEILVLKSEIENQKSITENLDKRYNNYISKVRNVEQILGFNPLFPSLRNASRMRNLGRKVKKSKKVKK